MERFLSLIADRYVPGWKGKLLQEDAVFYPDAALCHPEAAEPFFSAKAFRDWQHKHKPALQKGPVAILAMLDRAEQEHAASGTPCR